MKNTKKLLSFSLSILVMLSAITIIPVTVGAISIDKADKPITMITDSGYQYRVVDGKGDNNRENDYIEIVGYKGVNTSSVSIISSISYTYSDGEKRTLPVAKLGYDAFRGFDKIETVSIPSSVVEIGYGVFHGCTALKEITIPNSVTAIGNFAFSDCKSLNKITFSSTLKSIGEFAFAECDSLINVTLPDSVTFIDDFAFAQCDNLTNVDLGTGKKTIGWLILDGSPKAVNVKNNNSSVKMRTSSAPAFNFESIEIPQIDGDANLDGKVNISDATAAQKYIAKISNEISKKADYNNDGVVNVLDVTAIQKSVAKIG